MNKETILCYKLCYCLGVPDAGRYVRYRAAHNAAKECKYFEELHSTRKFRALSYIYFMLIKHNQDYPDQSNMSDSLEFAIEDRAALASIDLSKVLASCDTLISCINILAREANKLLPMMYRELTPSVEYCDFARLLTLRDSLTIREVLKIQYVMRMSPQSLNIYFFADPIYNFAMNEMLSADKRVCERIMLQTGITPARPRDTSMLAQFAYKNREARYLRLEHLSRFSEIYVDDSSCSIEIRNAVDNLASDVFKVHHFDSFTDCVQTIPEQNDPSSSILLFRPAKEGSLDTLRWLLNRVSFLMLMPLRQELYFRVLDDEYENAYLFSFRNSNIKLPS